jgi:hypothetical protein
MSASRSDRARRRAARTYSLKALTGGWGAVLVQDCLQYVGCEEVDPDHVASESDDIAGAGVVIIFGGLLLLLVGYVIWLFIRDTYGTWGARRAKRPDSRNQARERARLAAWQTRMPGIARFGADWPRVRDAVETLPRYLSTVGRASPERVSFVAWLLLAGPLSYEDDPATSPLGVALVVIQPGPVPRAVIRVDTTRRGPMPPRQVPADDALIETSADGSARLFLTRSKDASKLSYLGGTRVIDTPEAVERFRAACAPSGARW